jgi:hypothetical protein
MGKIKFFDSSIVSLSTIKLGRCNMEYLPFYHFNMENNVVLGNDRFLVGVHKGCLNCLNGMGLGDNTRMTFF